MQIRGQFQDDDALGAFSAEPGPGPEGTIQLPRPDLSCLGPLGTALAGRRSTRDFLPDEVPEAKLSTVLWAAFGVNRQEGCGRTAPSTMNWQEIRIIACTKDGCWRYEAGSHQLHPVVRHDLRNLMGIQPATAQAPLNLVYVADFSVMTGVREEHRPFLAGADTGVVVQNVYLACAGCGLGTVVHGLVDRRALAQALGLGPTQRITLVQSIGLQKTGP